MTDIIETTKEPEKNDTPLKITERAIKEIKTVMQEQGFEPAEYVLEVGVVGGGCSGFSYKLGFKERKDIDQLNETTLTFGDIDVAVYQRALLYINGTTIDFHDGLNKRGFVFDNPLSVRTCGCGSSFGV